MIRRMSNKIKRIWTILMITALLITMIPLSRDGTAYAASTGTFHYGSIIRDAKGKAYSWKKSQMAPAYWWDANGNRIKDEAATYESSTAGMERYTIDVGGKTIAGYCIAHGIRVDTTTRLTSKKDLDKWTHTGAYPASSKAGITYALVYGYQEGRHISDLADNGFSKSSYWHKTADRYTLDDWYIATQVLIWEYQQLIRTDSISGGHGRQNNGLVAADHYYSIIRGRAASDIYNYMVSCVKKHNVIASFSKGNASTAKTSKGWQMKKDGATGNWSCTLKDGNSINVDIKATGASAKNWQIKKSGNKYTFIYKGKNLSQDGTVFQFAKKIPLKESYQGGDMLIWSWSSSGSLRQAVATGVPDDPVQMYIKFYSGTKPEEKEGEPEPDYWPTFEFPVHKDDKNPGWDGDQCTPMGDATLASTFVLYRNGEEVDRVTLDEYGSTQVLTDQPWSSAADLSKTPSGSYTHTETDADGNVTTHCVVTPTQLEWRNTENIEYTLEEIPSSARFTEPDSGTGTGIRKYTVDYYAITNDSRTCVTQEPAWADIKYTIHYKTTEGTNPGDETAAGSGDDLDDQLSMNEETWVNDNYRGKLLIKKQKESEDVFNEEGSSGSLYLSTKSCWKMYLNSGGYENHPYLSFKEDGHTEDGARKYKAVRDTSGVDNATTDMLVSETGSLFITDIPYGSYTVEEVKADDESFVLESFQVFIAEDGKQYTKSITNKKKENVIKVIKTDAETGKQVNLKGTKFYIRYMGNPLLPESERKKQKNYGRLLPNASDINSTSKDYTFTCNSFGSIVLPYDLEFGEYRLEEFLLPDGYFVGKYGQDGNGANADYGQSGEYGKDDDGKADSSMSWETVKDDDPSNDLVAIYDKDGSKAEYKAKDIFNFYTFRVEKQDSHMDGEEYAKYYKAVAMKNNPVKGKIEVTKEGEILAGFEKTQKDGYTVWTPKYVWSKLKDAVFGIYAAIDEWLSDGNDGSQIYDSKTGDEIKIPADTKTHSGVNGKGKIYEEGTYNHESGAKLYYKKLREAATDNHYTRIYTTPQQRPTTYKYTFEQRENGFKYLYNVEAEMKYNAGGMNFTKIKVTKVTSVENGFAVDIPTTDATSVVGGQAYSPAINVGDADGNVFDVLKQTNTFEIDGEKVYDEKGSLIYDLGDIGAERYVVKDYAFYQLTAADMKPVEKVIEEDIDKDGDGKYDGEGEKAPVTETRLSYEWEHDVTLVNPAEGGKTVVKDGETYKVLTTNYDWVKSDESGQPEAQYTLPEGWNEVLYVPDIEVDEGETIIKSSHYAIISQTSGEGVTSYKVLLTNGTWQDCNAEGNFKKMVVEEYNVSYTQQGDNESGFTFELDGITISSQAQKEATATTVISNPFDAAPAIQLGIGYTQKTEDNATTFTAKEPSAPVYFMSEDGIKTEMYYFGHTTRTLLTIPMKAVEANYGKVVPGIVFTRTGEVIDWYSKLSPDDPVFKREAASGNTVTATRYEGGKDSNVYYTVEIISDQTMEEGDGPFEITYSDGYTAKVYKTKSEDGNDMGVLVMDGVYKTSTAALGDLVDTITTGDDGTAVSKELPLGKYIVRELSAPEGYVADTEIAWNVNLQYKDQYTPLVWKLVKSQNEYVKVELDVSKVFETGYETGQYVPGEGAVFGIYNADPVAYGKATLPADRLIDTLTVDSSGKALSQTKIPAGVYYLKELKTRNGYLLNDTLFYFVAGDSVKSAPLDISKDADGKDTDGLTAKVVMDGYGKATVTIETLNRQPAAAMTINGKTYPLDQDAADPYVNIKTCKDMSRTKVTVTDHNPAEITLANDKTLTLTVTGNTYKWTYDGQNGEYVPTVTNTGYYADYTLPEKQADPKNPIDKTLVLTAADSTSAITVKTVYEKQQQLKPGTEEYENVLDKNGNPVFDHFAEVSLTAGTLVSAGLGEEELKPDELNDPIKLQKGKKLVLKSDDKAAYIIRMDKVGNITTSVSNTLASALTEENAPRLTIDGAAVTDGFHLTKSITTARQDSSAKTVQVKINTLDNVNSGEIKNDADKTPDVPVTPPGPGSTPKGSIEITKTDMETGETLPGAEFEIWNSKVENGKNAKDKVVFKGATGTDGKMKVDNLNYGVYYYHETKAPVGYKVDGKYYMVEINAGHVIARVTMDNEKATGAIKITKTDIADGKPLPDAGFKIYDKNKTIVAEDRTDHKGTAYFDQLPLGEYYYQEFDAPEGYQIDEGLFTFEIREDGQVVKAVMTNQKKPVHEKDLKKPKKNEAVTRKDVPETGDHSRLAVYLMLAVIAASAMITAYKKRGKKQNSGKR